MDDLIKRQDAIDALENTDCELTPSAWDELTDAIMQVPPAEQEKKTGKWIKDEEQSREHTEPIFICSCCQNNSAWGTEERTRYCSFCGADMRGEDNV